MLLTFAFTSIHLLPVFGLSIWVKSHKSLYLWAFWIAITIFRLLFWQWQTIVLSRTEQHSEADRILQNNCFGGWMLLHWCNDFIKRCMLVNANVGCTHPQTSCFTASYKENVGTLLLSCSQPTWQSWWERDKYKRLAAYGQAVYVLRPKKYCPRRRVRGP